MIYSEMYYICKKSIEEKAEENEKTLKKYRQALYELLASLNDRYYYDDGLLSEYEYDELSAFIASKAAVDLSGRRKLVENKT